LALPYRLSDFVPSMDKLGELTAFIRAHNLRVIGVHAPQGSLVDDDFGKWATPTMQFTRDVGAGYCVFHPNRAAKTRRSDLQIIARDNLRALHIAVPEVLICLESFSGDRVYTPEEIVESPWLLVLDLSHVDPGRAYALIQASCARIGVIHVSEIAWYEKYAKQRSHMPAGPTCARAFELLRQKKWDGVLTLEYLPDFRAQMITDRVRIEAEFGVFSDD
jgi:hypothetical protein